MRGEEFLAFCRNDWNLVRLNTESGGSVTGAKINQPAETYHAMAVPGQLVIRQNTEVAAGYTFMNSSTWLIPFALHCQEDMYANFIS